jgi:hypothetical protein
MRVACMQPYLFPYRGYFDLIKAVDAFVIEDDLKYIKGGWVNRNNFPMPFTFRLKKHSDYARFNEIYFYDIEDDKKKFVRVTHLPDTYLQPLKQQYTLSYNIARTLKKICKKLDIHTPFYFSSYFPHGKFVQGVIDMVKAVGGDTYVNLPGGRKLYTQEMFGNIKLDFIDTISEPSILTYLT